MLQRVAVDVAACFAVCFSISILSTRVCENEERENAHVKEETARREGGRGERARARARARGERERKWRERESERKRKRERERETEREIER